MKIQIEKRGNSLVVPLPRDLATRLGLDEGSAVELIEEGSALVIRKKRTPPSLEELVNSAKGFRYPEDVMDFVNGSPVGRELI